MILFLIVLLFSAIFPHKATAYSLPTSGKASVTHYHLGNSTGSCDCKKGANIYPVAAINQNAYGANACQGAGSACGLCFRISIISALTVNISYPENQRPEAVFKVVDMCPAQPPNLQWCAQTDILIFNAAGLFVHFDLASTSLPKGFLNYSGRSDPGVWISEYEEVDCALWAGYNDTNATGPDPEGCCPKNPFTDKDSVCPVPTGSCSSAMSMCISTGKMWIMVIIAVLTSSVISAFEIV